MSSQTQIQNAHALIAGSGALYIGESFSALVNIGAIRDLEVKHKIETTELEFDNVPTVKRFKNGDKLSFVFKLAEIDPSLWELTNKSLVTVANIPGTLVSGYSETIPANTMTYGKLRSLAKQNANGSALTISNIVQGTTTLVANTDYRLAQNTTGEYGIILVISSNADLTKETVVTYSYTPTAYKQVTFANSGVMGEVVARFLHTDSRGQTFAIDLQNVCNIKTLGIDFPGDTEEDVALQELELSGYLVEIRDGVTA